MKRDKKKVWMTLAVLLLFILLVTLAIWIFGKREPEMVRISGTTYCTTDVPEYLEQYSRYQQELNGDVGVPNHGIRLTNPIVLTDQGKEVTVDQVDLVQGPFLDHEEYEKIIGHSVIVEGYFSYCLGLEDQVDEDLYTDSNIGHLYKPNGIYEFQVYNVVEVADDETMLSTDGLDDRAVLIPKPQE